MSILKISFRYHLQKLPGCAMIRSVVSIPVRFQSNPVWVPPCAARHRVLGLPWCIQKSPLRSMKTSSSTCGRFPQPTDDPDPSCFLCTPALIILNGMDLGVFPSKPHSSTVNRLIGGYCDPKKFLPDGGAVSRWVPIRFQYSANRPPLNLVLGLSLVRLYHSTVFHICQHPWRIWFKFFL